MREMYAVYRFYRRNCRFSRMKSLARTIWTYA